MRECVWSDCVVFTSVLSARPSSERLAIRFGGNAVSFLVLAFIHI